MLLGAGGGSSTAGARAHLKVQDVLKLAQRKGAVICARIYCAGGDHLHTGGLRKRHKAQTVRANHIGSRLAATAGLQPHCPAMPSSGRATAQPAGALGLGGLGWDGMGAVGALICVATERTLACSIAVRRLRASPCASHDNSGRQGAAKLAHSAAGEARTGAAPRGARVSGSERASLAGVEWADVDQPNHSAVLARAGQCGSHMRPARGRPAHACVHSGLALKDGDEMQRTRGVRRRPSPEREPLITIHCTPRPVSRSVAPAAVTSDSQTLCAFRRAAAVVEEDLEALLMEAKRAPCPSQQGKHLEGQQPRPAATGTMSPTGRTKVVTARHRPDKSRGTSKHSPRRLMHAISYLGTRWAMPANTGSVSRTER